MTAASRHAPSSIMPHAFCTVPLFVFPLEFLIEPVGMKATKYEIVL
jgi:hypothetical protein